MTSFDSLDLAAPLRRAITDLGFTEPTPVQAETLPILLGEDTDFMGQAATGTGKTVAFALPLLQKLDPALKQVQALVLTPTRELALQVAGQIDLLGKYLGVRALPIYGGSDYQEQFRGLHRGAQVVVGTPGRLCDHLDRGSLKLDALHTLVLDEADEMISMGFKDELEVILQAAPREGSQRWMFSATMSPEVRKVASDYLQKPRQVQTSKNTLLSDTVEQIYYKVMEQDKPEILCRLIDVAEEFYGLIFCQTKALVVELNQLLLGRGFAADCLHGDMDQAARERTMRNFRERKATILVCTDVASRGLDVPDMTHVINYSLPRELEHYIHRIGRTARSGKAGVAMSLVTASHRGLIPRFEQATRRKMREGVIPTRRDLGAKKLNETLGKFLITSTHTRALEIMTAEWQETLATMAPEEIAARFLTLLHPEIFAAKGREPVRPMVSKPSESPRQSQRAPQRPAPRQHDRNDRGERSDRGDRGDRGDRSAPRPVRSKPWEQVKPLRPRPQPTATPVPVAAPVQPAAADATAPNTARARRRLKRELARSLVAGPAEIQ